MKLSTSMLPLGIVRHATFYLIIGLGVFSVGSGLMAASTPTKPKVKIAQGAKKCYYGRIWDAERKKCLLVLVRDPD